MKDDGLTIIFITHYLEEVEQIADKCVVLKDGEITFYGPMEGVTEKQLINYMIGQNLDHYYPEIETYTTSKIALELKGCGSGFVAPCDFKVHYGEVVGIAGLIGSGRTELMHMVIGAEKKEYGEIYLDGQELVVNHPGKALEAGIAYINEDRKNGGLNISMPVLFNLALPSLVKRKQELVNKAFY